MKTGPAFNKQSRDAYALLMVMILAGVSIIVFASAAKWTSSSILVTDRHNTYNRTLRQPKRPRKPFSPKWPAIFSIKASIPT